MSNFITSYAGVLKGFIFIFFIFYTFIIIITKNNNNKVKLVLFALIFFQLDITILSILNPIDRLWFISLFISSLINYNKSKEQLLRNPYLVSVFIFFVIFIFLAIFDQRYSIVKNLIRACLYVVDNFGIFLLLSIFIESKKDAIKVLKFFYYCMLICSFYSIVILLFRVNLYNDFFSELYGTHNVSKSLIDSYRMAISSFVINPHRYGLFLSIAIIIRIALYNQNFSNWKFSKLQIFFLLILILSNIMSNSRASYLALIIGCIIYSIFGLNKQGKIILLSSLFLYMLIVNFYTRISFKNMPQITIFKEIGANTKIEANTNSYNNENKKMQVEIEDEVSGSTIEMRIEQFRLSVELVKDEILIGRGFRWLKEEFGLDSTKKDFVMKKGYYGFESFIFVTLVETGILGLIAYFIVFGRIILYNFLKIIKFRKDENQVISCSLSLSIFLAYFVFIITTGEGHMTPITLSLIAILTKYIQVKAT